MEEEVELRDYINVLLKWKWLIIWLTILSMVVAGFVSYFLMKPVYEGSADIIPPVVGSEQIFSAEETQTLIKSNSFTKIVSEKTGIPYSEVDSGMNVSVIKGTNLVEVKFENSSKEKISKFFDVSIPLLNEQNKELYNNKIDAIKAKLLTLEGQFGFLKEQEQVIFDRIKQIKKDGRAQSEYALEYSLLLNTYNSVVGIKMSTEQQISNLKSQLKTSHNFIYLNSPVVPTHPVKPKKMFNIAVAGVAAFFFAILLAFFLEYWRGSEDDKKKKVKA